MLETDKNHDKSKYSIKAMIILSAVITATLLLSFIPDNYKKTPPPIVSIDGKNYLEHNLLFFDFMYKNKKLYPEYCKKNGYDPQNYVRVFDRIFANENKETENMFKTMSQFFPSFKNDMEEKNKYFLTNNSEKELNIMRKALILSQLETIDQSVKPEWNDRYYEAYPIKLVCKYLDQNAEKILTMRYRLLKRSVHK